MSNLTQNQLTKELTQSWQNAPTSTQIAVMGTPYTPNMEQLVTLEDVRAVSDNLTLADWENLITPVLVNKIYKTEMTNFIANNPFARFIKENSPWGRQKEHIVSMYATIIDLQGTTDPSLGDNVLNATYKSADSNPSTKDWFPSVDYAYYTNHIRAFVAAASINQSELKAAFRGLNSFNEFANRKTSVVMERSYNIEFFDTAKGFTKMMLPQNIGLIDTTDANPDLALTLQPKITLLSADYTQTELAKYLRRYVNNVKFPDLAKQENPLGLPLITPENRLLAYITPDIMANQDFLEAYAFTQTKVTLPTTTEMMSPLPPVKLTNQAVDTIGNVSGVGADGTYSGNVLPIAFICDEDCMEINHSVFYTDVETNKTREFITPQLHDHFSIHPSYEKNIRFFAVPLEVVPDAPTFVGTVGDGEIAITVTDPVNTGSSPITDRVVSYSANGGTTVQTLDLGTELTGTITGLTNGTAYQVSVTVSNNAGSSLPSATQTITPVAH